jgi:hypothetical protein
MTVDLVGSDTIERQRRDKDSSSSPRRHEEVWFVRRLIADALLIGRTVETIN